MRNSSAGTVLILVDMINEFVSGKYGSPRAEKMVPHVLTLLNKARQAEIPVIYVRDAHRENDPELKVWGKHAMEGTTASEIVTTLKPEKDETVFSKRQYSAFLNTGIDRKLKRIGARSIIFAGISADICVQHNVADAFYRGYTTLAVRECVESISADAKERALKYMETIYGTKILSLKQVEL
ncbi:MAG: cysteine hydrolase [Thermoplasmata archaeon]|nr:cysteine hydrolase [Candidatus Sysuiplasma jiujiangense]MBX8641952.1 cysteine hydrolase [Candidatus Sysuiplasma jiujiangense]